MSGQKYTSFLLKSLVSFLLFAGGYTSVFALPGFIVDGSNGANSTGPCTGKTVCHISGDLTYSDITLINGGKLSHRQGTLTVSNNFLLGGTGAGFFVGQNTIVGNLLKIQGDSVFALNSNLTSNPASNNISDWMGATYYDLQVSNTNLSFTGMDVSLSTSCTTAGGGSTLSACIQTRNVNVNSKLSAIASATNVVWKTYANGYLAVDGDATLTNIKMDVAGYLFVQGNVFGSFNNAHYVYVTGGQQVATPDAVGFTTAGVRVDGNMTLTGSASLPDFYMSGATGTAADNWYVSGSLFVKQMSLGVTGKTNSNSLGYITAKNGSITITDADTLYFNGNVYSKGDLVFTNNSTVDWNDVTSNNGNISLTNGTSHTYGAINVTNGTLAASGITTLNRNGNIATSSHITFSNITTSNGTTSVTSTNGNISITTGTTHTYGNIVASGGTLAINGVATLNRAGNITTKNDISLTNVTTSSGAATNVTSTNGNVTMTTGTTHTYQDISAFGNLSFSGITTSLDTRTITNTGATTLTNVLLHNRKGNITTFGDILFNNVTTSSGSTTNVTSTAGNITVTTGTTHTYNYLNAYKDNFVTSITSYNANNISTNGGFIMTWSTLNITDMTDASDETKQNIDISTGSGFIITNSTANLQNSSIQTNGYLEVNNTDWKSQNLNINGYMIISGEKVGVYFRGGKDRTIFGTIFAGGGSIWVGTAATPDDGNIFLKRKAGVTTNGNIKMYRSNTTIVDGFATAPDVVPTPNTSLFTQLYNASLLSLSGSITVLTGSTTNKDYVIDGNTATFYESSTAGSVFRVDFPRDMIISKMCVVAGTNEPDNIKLQFMDASSTIINTQTQKMPTTGQPRTCFDLNSYKARKILVTGYGASTTLGFGELEFWGVPADTANIAAPFGNDIVLQNGSYEFWGVLTSGNLNASSTTGKKIRAIQYHNNAPFNHKNSIALASASAGGTTFTHSVGNEAGLRFITDTMNVGANVTVDVVGKGYLGGNSNNEFYTSTGWVGNITPGALKIAAGDGGMGGGIGGYGVSGGGGGGGMLGVKNSGVWGSTTQKFFTGSKGGGYTQTQCIIDSPYGQEGRLRCSGRNDYAQIGNNSTSNVSSFTEVTATSLSGGVNKGWSYVSNAYHSTCGIKDGSVYCWGYRWYGIMADGNPTATNQLIPLQIGTTGDLAANGGNVNFVKVLAGPSGDNEPTCALKINGDLYCWGENSNYQIDNTGVDILYPKLVGTGIKDFGVNYRRIAIIDSTGRVWQRGQNYNADIVNIWPGYTNSNSYNGNHTYYICTNAFDSYCGTPAGVSYGNWIKKIDGQGEAWGETGFESIYLAGYSSCVIKAGAGYCWGYNNTSYGAVGVNDGSYNFHTYFRALRVHNGSLTYNNNIKEMWPMQTGPYYSGTDSWCLLRNGAPYCWGYNASGYYELWQNTTATRYYPQYWGWNVSNVSYGQSNYYNGNYSEIIPQMNGWCAIGNNGYLYCWGRHNDGYYPWGYGWGGNAGYPYQVGYRLESPMLSASYDAFTQSKYPAFDAHGGSKTGGYSYTNCVVASDSSLWCSGYNNYGQIGDNSTTDRSTWTQVNASNLPGALNKGWTQVSAGYSTSCGINAGKVYCWGYGGNGQIGNSSSANVTIPTQISWGSLPSYGGNADFGKVLVWPATTDTHVCAMKTSGTYKGYLFCWGYGGNYQISTSGNGSNLSPVLAHPSIVAGGNVWRDFALGYQSTFAIDSSGVIHGRGYNYFGNIFQDTGSYNGYNTYGNYGCANHSNYWCTKGDSWGNVWTNSSYTYGFERIYAQYYTVCGLRNGTIYCWWYSGTNNGGNTNAPTYTAYPLLVTNTDSITSTNTFENNDISELWPNGWTTSNGWCALRRGKVYCWGYNGNYQNGQNTTSNFVTPYDITSTYLPGGTNANFAGIMYGWYQSACGIQTSGAVYCWGYQGTSYSGWGDGFSGNQTSGYAYQGSAYVPSLRSNFTFTSVQTWFAGAGPGSGGGNLGYGGYGGSATCTGSLGNNSLGNTKGGNGGGALGGSGSNWHGGGGQVGPCSGGGGGTGGNSDANPYRLGSGGGAGGLAQNDYTKGYGGNGGGMIRISTNTLILSWSLLATGNVGKDTLITANAPTIAAWAGGAGGSILIRAKSLTCATGNAIDVKGGNGWAGASNVVWGGGGGGWVITYYYTNKTGTCNGAVLAGAGGTNGGATGGQDGKVYESVGTTFDTLKSRVTIENSPAAADGVQAVTVRAYFLDVNGVPLEGEYLVAEVVGDLGTGKINGGSPLPQTDANGMLSFPVTSTVKGIKKIILKNALTYTELQEQPTLTFGIPQVSIAKVADKSTVNSGDVVTYTITLTNSGSGDAGGDPENAIVIEDVLPTGFTYWTTGPTAGSKWDTGSGTTQYYIFPEVTGDGTAGNEQRLRYTVTDGLSGPANIPSGGGKVRILFDVKAP